MALFPRPTPPAPLPHSPAPYPPALFTTGKILKEKKKVTSAVGTLRPLPFLPSSLIPLFSVLLRPRPSLFSRSASFPSAPWIAAIKPLKLLGLKKIQLKKDFKKLKRSICSRPLRTLRLQSGRAGSEQSAGRCTSR